MQLRHDQLVLALMAGVIGLTVIFASGVERGKQLARAERAMLSRPQAVPQAPQTVPAAAVEQAEKPATQVSAAAPVPIVAPAVVTAPATSAGQGPAQKKTEPAKTPKGKSRYAVQVVTCSRPLLAKKEMDRLRATGERAFLIIRDGGRTVVYVGPFPSKDHAVEKVSLLKMKYRDCFVKTL